MKMPFRTVAAAFALFAAAGAASASSHGGGDGGKAEKMVEYRQALFTAIAYNFKPLVAQLKGEMPYDAEMFAARAQRIGHLAPMVGEGFSDPATADVDGTHAKAAIWENREDFQEKGMAFGRAAADLAEAAQAKPASVAEMKEQVAAMGKACKA